MNESEFEARLGAPINDSETEIKVSGSGKFIFLKQRIFGVLHFVKKPASDFIGDPQVMESLRKEFSIGIHLNHPGVVRYINFDGQALYEEFIDGQNLRELIIKNDSRLHDKEFVCRLVCQLFETVDYLHQAGVLHLDLKPENILIPRIGNQSKIIDFGCAVNSQNDSTQGYTPKYKAPEQGTTQSDCRTDIYQIGKIAAELSAPLKMSKKWRNFIKKAVSEKPDNRFHSAGDALQTLQRINQKKSFPGLTFIGMLIVALTTAALVATYFKLTPPQGPPSDPVPSSPSVTQPQPIITQEALPEQAEIMEKPAKSKESAKSKEPEVAIPSSQPKPIQQPEETTESKIKNELQSKIRALYKKNVTPYTSKTSSLEEDERFNKMKEGFRECQAEAFKLMEQLKLKYPSMTDYIEAETTSIIENQQLQALFKYEQTQSDN